MGESRITSLGGARYIVMFTDKHSKRKEAYFTKTKDSETVLEIIKSYCTDIGKPELLFFDNGREFDNTILEKYCINVGI